MGILDGIVEWIAKQVMNGLDLISTSVLGALGCDMGTFLRYFPAAETMYKVFVATAIGLVLLNWVWQLFKNFGLVAGVEAEDPIRLSIRSVLFIGLIYYCDQITDMALAIGGDAVFLDTLLRSAALKLCGLQFRPADHPRRMCKRFRCPDRTDTPADPCMELHQAAL